MNLHLIVVILYPIINPFMQYCVRAQAIVFVDYISNKTQSHPVWTFYFIKFQLHNKTTIVEESYNNLNDYASIVDNELYSG